MNSNSIERVMAQLNVHVTYINRSLKDIKSEVVVDSIRSNNKSIVVTTLDLNIIEEYIKNLNDVNSSDVMSSRLPQSKSYLKILGILYFVENTNISLTSDIIKRVIEITYIFNNVVLAF